MRIIENQFSVKFQATTNDGIVIVVYVQNNKQNPQLQFFFYVESAYIIYTRRKLYVYVILNYEKLFEN